MVPKSRKEFAEPKKQLIETARAWELKEMAMAFIRNFAKQLYFPLNQ